MKALSDVSYRNEEERRKPGKRRQRKVVHFNYLKPCFTLPEIQEKPSWAATSTRVEEKPPVETLRDVRQPTQGTSADSKTLNWNGWKTLPLPAQELLRPSQGREESGALSTSPPPADVPSQPESSLTSDELSRELCNTPASETETGRRRARLAPRLC